MRDRQGGHDRSRARSARKNIAISLGTMLAVFVVITVVNDRFDVLGDGSRSHHRSAGQVISDLAGITVGAIVVVALLLVAWRFLPARSRDRLVQPWSVPARQRRRMDRAVRRGQPSADPALAAAEHDRAARAVRLRWVGPLLFGLCCAGGRVGH